MDEVQRIRERRNLWDNARFILTDIPLERRKAQKWLPFGMRLTEAPAATLFIANYTKTSFTVPYKEAGLLIHVKTLLGRGMHCCWMVVDDDTAMIYGRELLGYPKKMAEFTFEEDETHIQASVRRRGIQLLSMAGERGEKQLPPPPFLRCKIFNTGGPGQSFAFNPVWMSRTSERIRESYTSSVDVKLENSQFDPLTDIIAGDPFNGRIVILDIAGGKIPLPVGFAGPKWLDNVYNLRIR
jgi:acetoacetate decarboxylase